MDSIRNSTIVKEEEINMIKDWINPNETFNFELLYRASRDGDEVRTFHRLCDGKGPTLVVIKNIHNSRFGGFTAIPWSSIEGYKTDENSLKSFIFSLDAKKKYGIVNKVGAVYHNSGYGPTFGRGHDFTIGHLCLHQAVSSCKCGYDYDACFKEMTKEVINFLISDYEVYLIKK